MIGSSGQPPRQKCEDVHTLGLETRLKNKLILKLNRNIMSKQRNICDKTKAQVSFLKFRVSSIQHISNIARLYVLTFTRTVMRILFAYRDNDYISMYVCN